MHRPGEQTQKREGPTLTDRYTESERQRKGQVDMDSKRERRRERGTVIQKSREGRRIRRETGREIKAETWRN